MYRISSLESKSAHPMAMAVVADCRQQGIEPSAEVKDFNILQGEEICGVIDSQNIYIGNHHLKTQLCWGQDVTNTWNMEGSTVAYVGVDTKFVGEIEVHVELLAKDKLRFIRELKKEGIATMVSDRINDALALPAVDVGIAMDMEGSIVAVDCRHNSHV
ncbi:hypothetical protein SUGI_0098910 [Cryptomeria japonica]|nr:hypothetical protein SUGI_0098910 [Cryptomeria japonica]